MTRPPRLARRVLRFFVPADIRDSVDGDLAEVHAAHVAARGRTFATVWYWRETMLFAAGFIADRIKRGARALAATRHATSSLDVRLSARLLIKQPGLTLTAGFGIAAAIGISTGFFAFLTANLRPTIPLDEGDRIVALENTNLAWRQPDRRLARDFLTWRDEMRTVVEVSAFRSMIFGLETGPASVEDIGVAGMTASGFRVARVSALLGRHLVPDDERPGAPPVLVIGYDVWRTRFAGDSSIVGRQVRVNEMLFTVVGVMPAGFGFPVNHQYWTTLRMDPSRVERGKGPELFVFGRLAPGATMQSAATELAALGHRAAAAFPQTNGQLRPHVLPYAFPFMGLQNGDASDGDVWRFQLTILLIVIVAALNVAILVYARTAVRRSEIAVRTALGASRRRIVGQLFVEALALSLPPAVFGIGLAQYGLRLGTRLFQQSMDVTDRAPFWIDNSLRLTTVAYALGLALVVATIVGVLPALRATGRHIESDLRQLGGATGMQLGKMWTVLIIAQVAIAVAILPLALKNGLHEARGAFNQPTYPAQDFMSGWLSVKLPPAGGPRPAFGARVGDVVRNLRANPSVAGVTFNTNAPTGGRDRTEVEGLTPLPDIDWRVRPQAVDTSYLELYGARLLTGRRFTSSDLADSARVVIVNRSFVRRMLAGRSALGRRLRYVTRPMPDTATPPPWFEIVGVVEDLRRNTFDPDDVAPVVYHPVAPERLPGVMMVIRTKGAPPPGFGQMLHETIAATDAGLQLRTMRSGSAADAESKTALQIIGTILLLVLAAVLLLSAAGVYALMSFTVTQRRREMGIRAALGASQRQVLIKVFSRVAWQIGAGVAAGALAAALINSATGSDTKTPTIILVPIVAIVMVIVGLGAAFVPARRGLAVQPVEALRYE
jgi:putative ABC transport system permease protein